MTRITRHRITVLAAAALVLGIVTGAIAPMGEAEEPAPALGALAPLSEAEAVVAETAMAAFVEAGMGFDTTPVVSFHREKADCAGNLGYWVDEDGIDRIRVCWTHDDPAVEAVLQTQAMVHELAHAWAHRNVDDADRAAFSEFVGVESWEGADAEWIHRGTEVAAELITWAVLDPAVSFIDFDEAGCRDWAAAFELLAGRPAPAHVAGACG